MLVSGIKVNACGMSLSRTCKTKYVNSIYFNGTDAFIAPRFLAENGGVREIIADVDYYG